MYHIVVCIRLIFRVLPDWLIVGGDRERGAGERTAAGGGVGDQGEEGGQEHGEKEEVGTSREDRRTREGIDGKSRSRGRRCSPFYMLSRFSSSHIQKRVLAPLLRSCDHSAAGSLCAQGRPGRHRLNP